MNGVLLAPPNSFVVKQPRFWAIKLLQLRNVMNDVTRLLDAARQGDVVAADKLLPLVYGELRKLAASKMANEAPGQTLQPTALVHEAWLKLADGESPKFEGRAHFFAAAATAMRRNSRTPSDIALNTATRSAHRVSP